MNRFLMAVTLMVAALSGCTDDDSSGQQWSDFDEPPWAQGIEVGKTYEYSVSVHCGIEQVCA